MGRAFARHLAAIVADGPIDLACITGSIAADEGEARAWVDDLCDRLGVEKKRVFVAGHGAHHALKPRGLPFKVHLISSGAAPGDGLRIALGAAIDAVDVVLEAAVPRDPDGDRWPLSCRVIEIALDDEGRALESSPPDEPRADELATLANALAPGGAARDRVGPRGDLLAQGHRRSRTRRAGRSLPGAAPRAVPGWGRTHRARAR